MATIDILYDLAFLIMDLWHRGLRSSANLVINRYLDERDETDGLPALPFFMAAGRLFVHMSRDAERADASGNRDQLSRRRDHISIYRMQLLAPVPARLIVIGGLSGTGKSTLAAAIAEHLGRLRCKSAFERPNSQTALGSSGRDAPRAGRVHQKFRSASTPIYSRRRG